MLAFESVSILQAKPHMQSRVRIPGSLQFVRGAVGRHKPKNRKEKKKWKCIHYDRKSSTISQEAVHNCSASPPAPLEVAPFSWQALEEQTRDGGKLSTCGQRAGTKLCCHHLPVLWNHKVLRLHIEQQ